MIKLLELYQRIVETTGLDVVTIGSLKAAISNCFADLTSRGYKTFKELVLTKEDIKTKVEEGDDKYYMDYGMVQFPCPKNISKQVYMRVYFPDSATIAQRYSLSNKRVGFKYIDGKFRSAVEYNNAIYYTKNDQITLEWHESCGLDIDTIAFGYYEKLYLDPKGFPTSADDTDALKTYELDIREEFEDAIVFYAAYFYYARYVKDTDKINHYLSQYKYYVEDITHELAYEDEFNEEDAVIKIEED